MVSWESDEGNQQVRATSGRIQWKKSKNQTGELRQRSGEQEEQLQRRETRQGRGGIRDGRRNRSDEGKQVKTPFAVLFVHFPIGLELLALIVCFECATMATAPYNYSYIFKYIIIGDMGVGKSCLLHQFTEKKFMADCPHTIGVEFGTRIIEVSGQKIKLQIWDTAGQERFRAVTRSYYRGAAGALMVYDITRRSTYNHLSSWLTDARNLTNPNTVIILIGNKADLEAQRDVTYEEAKQFAEENGGFLVRFNGVRGENVEDAFLEAAKKIYQNIQDGSLDLNAAESGVQHKPSAPQGGRLTSEPQPQREGCGC
ncbi:hypothetical protein E5288_WYG006761 [Bos mutus]|uniref:Ras-related protein Rab-14 n=1 Tax=Bos mutus TaxID=72004 RepID=A0A6B0RIH3_9CETA|nr:hypothetical protein [Bos mutus]